MFAPCPEGTTLDPRYECQCTAVDKVKALFDHPYDANCEKTFTSGRVLAENIWVEEAPYECDDHGKKICRAEGKCPTGFVWDWEACMCFNLMKCRMMCPEGMDLDPRYACKCVPQADIVALTMCLPNTSPLPREKPEPMIITAPINGTDSRKCRLTVDDCPSKNFSVDLAECRCVCDLVCIATMAVDTATCSCQPIKFTFEEATGDYIAKTPLPLPLKKQFKRKSRVGF